MNIITIDCGASYLKIALINEDTGTLIKSTERSMPSPDRTEAAFYHVKNISFLLESIRSLLSEFCENIQETYLAISNEMHGFILCDVKGVPVTDYISWQNECSSKAISDSLNSIEVLRQVVPSECILNTGMPIKSGLPSTSLQFMHLKGYLDVDGEYYFYTLGDYLIRALSGQTPSIHITNAAATGLFDITCNEWNKSLIELCTDVKIIFPSIFNEDGCLITFRFNETDIHVFPAIGDQQAALLGADLKEGEVSFNIGTGSQVTLLGTKCLLSSEYQTRPYFFGKYLYTVPHIPAGRSINVFTSFVRDTLRTIGMLEVSDDDLWERLLICARNGNEVGLNIDLGFFSNAITSGTKGSITNIPEIGFNIGNLYYSIFHQMAVNISIAYHRLPHANVCSCVFTGGVVIKNAFLRKCILEQFCEIDDFRIVTDDTMFGLLTYIKNCRKIND